MEEQSCPRSTRYLLVAIGTIIVGYSIAAAAGWPQHATGQITESKQLPVGDSHAAEVSVIGHVQDNETGARPPIWTIFPFALLLAAIAIFPLLPAAERFWESNRNKFLVAALLGVITLLYYVVLHAGSVEGHWPVHHVVERSQGGATQMWTVLTNALLNEYVPFIVLLLTLYTISGGIRIEGDLQAQPLTNTAFLAAGGLLASIIGTTGAAMLLIRPLLETNHQRKHLKHTVIFFIFVVCNCGGCLLPLGDPPLFLGYLRGVPFLWTLRLWPAWLFVNGMLCAIYFFWDHFFAYPREKETDIRRDRAEIRGLRFSGLWPNAVLLLGVILSVAWLDPGKNFPGTDWRPWLYLREVVQLGLVGLSLVLGDPAVRQMNRFTYAAIIEVAALFLGIFICMQPPLQILDVEGSKLPLMTPAHFFWSSGSLSSVLDNAPTYAVFFEAARTKGGANLVPPGTGVAESLLVAVSLGAVFMGAMTYIGNGPNFMVKAVAEQSGVKMPSFFGYMLYSCFVLLPLFALTSWLFL